MSVCLETKRDIDGAILVVTKTGRTVCSFKNLAGQDGIDPQKLAENHIALANGHRPATIRTPSSRLQYSRTETGFELALYQEIGGLQRRLRAGLIQGDLNDKDVIGLLRAIKTGRAPRPGAGQKRTARP